MGSALMLVAWIIVFVVGTDDLFDVLFRPDINPQN
jgi:hypothetical protein